MVRVVKWKTSPRSATTYGTQKADIRHKVEAYSCWVFKIKKNEIFSKNLDFKNVARVRATSVLTANIYYQKKDFKQTFNHEDENIRHNFGTAQLLQL